MLDFFIDPVELIYKGKVEKILKYAQRHPDEIKTPKKGGSSLFSHAIIAYDLYYKRDNEIILYGLAKINPDVLLSESKGENPINILCGGFSRGKYGIEVIVNLCRINPKCLVGRNSSGSPLLHLLCTSIHNYSSQFSCEQVVRLARMNPESIDIAGANGLTALELCKKSKNKYMIGEFLLISGRINELDSFREDPDYYLRNY